MLAKIGMALVAELIGIGAAPEDVKSHQVRKGRLDVADREVGGRSGLVLLMPAVAYSCRLETKTTLLELPMCRSGRVDCRGNEIATVRIEQSCDWLLLVHLVNGNGYNQHLRYCTRSLTHLHVLA